MKYEYDHRKHDTWQAFVEGTRIAFVKISNDDCPENPLENWDGEGKIWSMGRRHMNHKSHEECCEILRTNKFAVPLSYFEHGNCLWMVQDLPKPAGVEFQWDGVEFAGVWEPDKCCIDNILGSLYHDIIKIIQYGRWEGDKKHKDYCPWILETPDGLRFDGWKKARAHAAKLMKAKHGKNARKIAIRQRTRDYAKGVCDLYTSYCNGDVYGFQVEIYDTIKDKDGDICEEIEVYRSMADAVAEDSCWGYYGSDEIEGTITTDHIQPMFDKYLNATPARKENQPA